MCECNFTCEEVERERVRCALWSRSPLSEKSETADHTSILLILLSWKPTFAHCICPNMGIGFEKYDVESYSVSMVDVSSQTNIVH